MRKYLYKLDREVNAGKLRALETRPQDTAWLYASETLSKVEKDALFKAIEQAISTLSTT